MVVYLWESLVSILSNKIFIAILVSVVVSHLLKFFLDWYTNKKFSFISFWRTGGMPSSHAATVVSMSMSVFFTEGVTTLFIIVIFFSMIVIRDSLGVRYSVGQQARKLNKLLHASGLEESVKVILGHTQSQVVVGAIIGAIVASLIFIF